MERYTERFGIGWLPLPNKKGCLVSLVYLQVAMWSHGCLP